MILYGVGLLLREKLVLFEFENVIVREKK